MRITDEFARLQELHETGALTEDEFTAAKAKVLASGNSAPDVGLKQDVKRLGIQNQILQLDQDRQQERENLMIRGRYGSRSVPSRGGSVGGAFFAGIIVLLLLGFTASMPHAGPLPFFGVGMIILGIVGGISGSAKADAYEQAEDAYQRRRAELTDQLDQQ